MWAGLLGSVIPAVWSFQLALRSRGLGSVFTTLHLRCEMEAAELLGVPDDFMQAALIPVAWTLGTNFKPAQRRPLDEIVYVNKWG
jgi:nitroreductase